MQKSRGDIVAEGFCLFVCDCFVLCPYRTRHTARTYSLILCSLFRTPTMAFVHFHYAFFKVHPRIFHQKSRFGAATVHTSANRLIPPFSGYFCDKHIHVKKSIYPLKSFVNTLASASSESPVFKQKPRQLVAGSKSTRNVR